MGRLARDDLMAPHVGPIAARSVPYAAPWRTVLARDDRGWLAFHGEVYNRQDLARYLGLAADAPLERVLLTARARWPGRWTQRLHGPWVVAEGPLHRPEVTLRRDPSGMLGLFHAATQDGEVIFATNLDDVARGMGTRPTLAMQGLQEYLRLLDIAAPNTIYQGVQAVPPGETLLLVAGAPPGREGPLGEKSLSLHRQEAAEALEARLAAAIERRLAGARRPAAFLSGGVDSALLCALASRQRPDLTAITVGFEGTEYDESPIAAALARHLGIRHEVLRFDREALVRALELAGRRAEQPMADPALPATLLAFQWAAERHDVVLDGTGADELLGAMPPRHMRVAVEWAARIPPGLRRGVVRGLGHIPPLAGYRPIFDFEDPAEVLMRWHGFRRPEIEALTGAPFRLERTRFHQVFRRFPPSAHFQRYSALLEAMPCERLTQALRSTGLHVAFPYWDPEVETLLRALPLGLRWRPGSPKHLLREVLARHVPRALWDVPKHGFNFPLQAFLQAEDFRLLRRYLLDGGWRQWQILAPKTVLAYAHRYMSGETELIFRVWALVVLAAWLEGHGFTGSDGG